MLTNYTPGLKTSLHRKVELQPRLFAKMPYDDDLERASSKQTERTPLLQEVRPIPIEEDDQASGSTLQDGRRTPQNEHEEAALLEPRHQPRTKWWYVWRVFWAVLGALVLALFIKGWIDADDTNVRSPLGANVHL